MQEFYCHGYLPSQVTVAQILKKFLPRKFSLDILRDDWQHSGCCFIHIVSCQRPRPNRAQRCAYLNDGTAARILAAAICRSRYDPAARRLHV